MNKIKDQIENFKQKLNDYLLMRNSIKTLSNVMRKYLIISIGFDDIYYGINNPKRFILCVTFAIITWMATLWHFFFLVSPDLWSLIENRFLPDHAKACVLGLVLAFFHSSTVTTDYILGQINGYFDTFKIFHILTVDLKSKHKLTEQNYKRLSIFSRFIIIVFLNYGVPLIAICLNALLLIIGILSYYFYHQFYMLLHLVLMTPAHLMLLFVNATTAPLINIYLLYYKFRFDQLNHQIKSISNGNSKTIYYRRDELFRKFIYEHNLLSLEIHKFNLLFRKSLSTFFVVVTLIKIITLYLAIYMKQTLARIIVVNVFVLIFIFGFGLSVLLSLQINSAKKSFKIIHSVVCKYKMWLQLRFKVN